MIIKSIIDKNFASVSIMEEITYVAELLKEEEYVAVVDERDQTIGIVTAKDLLNHYNGRIINCDFRKPALSPQKTIYEAINTIQKAKASYLPVFKGEKFMGVFGLTHIINYFEKIDHPLVYNLIAANINSGKTA